MIVDFHSHCDVSDPQKIREFVQTYEEFDVIACLSGGLFYGELDMVPNDEVIKICSQYPGRLYPLAKITLTDKTPDLGELHSYAEKGVKGFKFIYPYYEYDHDLYMDMYAEIEKIGLPVLFHTGQYRPNKTDTVFRRPVLKNMDPLNLDRIARSFQQLHIVMAHLGTSFWRVQAAELVKTHPNLYADLAGCGSWMKLSAEDLAELFCSPLHPLGAPDNFRKLVFGSDSYTSNTWAMTEGIGFYRQKLKTLGLSREICNGIMGDTVAKWIGLA